MIYFFFYLYSNLWYFVSKFTEFDANKLFRQYRKALKKPGDHDGEIKEEKSKHQHKDKKKDKKIKEEVHYQLSNCKMIVTFLLNNFKIVEPAFRWLQHSKQATERFR